MERKRRKGINVTEGKRNIITAVNGIMNCQFFGSE